MRGRFLSYPFPRCSSINRRSFTAEMAFVPAFHSRRGTQSHVIKLDGDVGRGDLVQEHFAASSSLLDLRSSSEALREPQVGEGFPKHDGFL